jgi:hypothetical protein
MPSLHLGTCPRSIEPERKSDSEAFSPRHPQNATRVNVQHFQVNLADEITFPRAIALKIKVKYDNSTCTQRDSAGCAGESGAMKHKHTMTRNTNY